LAIPNRIGDVVIAGFLLDRQVLARADSRHPLKPLIANFYSVVPCDNYYGSQHRQWLVPAPPRCFTVLEILIGGVNVVTSPHQQDFVASMVPCRKSGQFHITFVKAGS
jgi:hypothetical protein